MESWQWLTAEYEKPSKRFKPVVARAKPQQKSSPPVKILPNMTGLRTDEHFDEWVNRNRNETAVINFGSSWCSHCHFMFPHFINLSHAFNKLTYAVAQVDYLDKAVQSITYTPTFSVYKKGRKVDEFFGASEQALRDRLWLHSD